MDLREEIQDLLAVSLTVNKILDDVVETHEKTKELEQPASQASNAIVPSNRLSSNPIAMEPNKVQSQMFDNSKLIYETYIVKPEDNYNYSDCISNSPANSLEEFQRLEEQIAQCVDSNACPSNIWSKSWHGGASSSATNHSLFSPVSIHNPWNSTSTTTPMLNPHPPRAQSFQPVIAPPRRLPIKNEDDASLRKRSPSGGAKTILAHLEEEKQYMNNQVYELKMKCERLSEQLRKKGDDYERLKWEHQQSQNGSLELVLNQLKEENQKLLNKIVERDEKAVQKEKEIEKLITEQDVLLARITELLRNTEINSNAQSEKIKEMEIKLEMSEKKNEELKSELTIKESMIHQQDEDKLTLLTMQNELATKVGEVVRHSELSNNCHNEEIESLTQKLSLTEVRSQELSSIIEAQQKLLQDKDDQIQSLHDITNNLQQSAVSSTELQVELAKRDDIIREQQDEKQKLLDIQTELLTKVGVFVRDTESTNKQHNQQIEELSMKASEADKLLEITKKTLAEKDFIISQKEEERKKLIATQTELLLQLGELLKKSEISSLNEDGMKEKLLDYEQKLQNTNEEKKLLENKLKKQSETIEELNESNVKNEEILKHKISDLEADNTLSSQNTNEMKMKVDEMTETLKHRNDLVSKLNNTLNSVINDVPSCKDLSIIRSYVHPEILKRTTNLVQEAFEKKNLLGDEAARYISNSMDSLYGEHWQVVLYRHNGHGCFVYHNNDCFICYKLGSYHLVLFRY